LYTTVAALVFDQVFFPTENAAVGTLSALVTVAIGYITRPLGALIFGHFGDKVGRKSLLVITMLIMGLPTLIIGLLPGYDTIGIAAPILLLICRLLQGIGLGGEYAGAALATIESVPEEERGFYGSIPQLGNPVGGSLGTLFVLFFTTIWGDEAFAAWMWRIPFLLSALLLGYALVVRLHMAETGDFAELVKEDKIVKSPIKEVVVHHWKPLLLGLGARCSDAISGNVAGTVVIAYVATYLHMQNFIGLLATFIPTLIAIPLMLVVGKVSDHVGRKKMFVVGMILVAASMIPMFAMLNTKIVFVMVLGVILMRTCNMIPFAVQSAVLSDIFPPEVRYTGVSLVYQVTAIVGGLTPSACVAVLIAAHGNAYILGIVLTVTCALSALCGAALKKAAPTVPEVGLDGEASLETA
jgi:MHS family shikimate/dehydroshikimate transporter-like MFS transporter